MKWRRLASAITVRLIHEHEAVCIGLAPWHQGEATLHPRDELGSTVAGKPDTLGGKASADMGHEGSKGVLGTVRKSMCLVVGGPPQISDAPALVALY